MKMSLTINASTSGWKTTCIIFNKIHFILEIVLVFTGVLQTCPTEPLQQIDHRYYSTMFISELFNLWMWLRAELLCTHCIQAYGHNHNPNPNLNRADGQMVIFCCTSTHHISQPVILTVQWAQSCSAPSHFLKLYRLNGCGSYVLML